MRTQAQNANSAFRQSLSNDGLGVVSTSVIPAIGEMDSIRPARGPLTGETKITLEGAFRDYGGLKCKFTPDFTSDELPQIVEVELVSGTDDKVPTFE